MNMISLANKEPVLEPSYTMTNMLQSNVRSLSGVIPDVLELEYHRKQSTTALTLTAVQKAMRQVWRQIWLHFESWFRWLQSSSSSILPTWFNSRCCNDNTSGIQGWLFAMTESIFSKTLEKPAKTSRKLSAWQVLGLTSVMMICSSRMLN